MAAHSVAESSPVKLSDPYVFSNADSILDVHFRNCPLGISRRFDTFETLELSGNVYFTVIWLSDKVTILLTHDASRRVMGITP